MNQIPPVNYESPKPAPTLSKKEIAIIHKMLVSGEHALSRKSDLLELHKRSVAMFATLKEGLGEINEQKAVRDRAAVIARLDEMEQSVNSMEGMLRIEMAPKLRAMLNETLDDIQNTRSRRWPRVVAMGLMLFAGLVLGAVYSDELIRFASTVVAGMPGYFGNG